MNMTYLLLSPPDPELAKRLRERFPTMFGALRVADSNAQGAGGSNPREHIRDSLIPQAA